MSGQIRDLGPVERGSVLHVADADLTLEDGQRMRETIAKACGHNDFAIVATNGWADFEMLNEKRMAAFGWVRKTGSTREAE